MKVSEVNMSALEELEVQPQCVCDEDCDLEEKGTVSGMTQGSIIGLQGDTSGGDFKYG